jgi:hypothetical protein
MGANVSRWLALILLLLLGCEETLRLPPEPTPLPPVPSGSQFVAQDTGRLQGQVRWLGPLPAHSTLESVDQPLELASLPIRPRPNPHRLKVSPEGGLAGAFVWLEGIDPARAPPWQPEPARLTIQDRQFQPQRLVLRLGDSLTLQSRDPFPHTLQGRGASYFNVTIPRSEQPRQRALTQPGIVEVRSGSGAFWTRAYVLVQPHPLLAVTDAQGRFAWEQVPPGRYRLQAWHPNPQVVRYERSPDTRRVVQITFGEAFSTSCLIEVQTGQTARPELLLSLGGVQ